MKKLLCTLLLLLCFPLALHSGGIIGNWYSAVACTTATDSSQWAPTGQDDNDTASATWRATKVTLGSNITLTAYIIKERDTNQTGSDTVVMMNHDAGNDYPDETSEVADTEITLGHASIPDGAPPAVTEFPLASPTNINSGTYWVVIKEVDGIASLTYRDTSSSGDRYCSSYNSGSTWSCTDNFSLNIEVYGCLQ